MEGCVTDTAWNDSKNEKSIAFLLSCPYVYFEAEAASGGGDVPAEARAGTLLVVQEHEGLARGRRRSLHGRQAQRSRPRLSRRRRLALRAARLPLKGSRCWRAATEPCKAPSPLRATLRIVEVEELLSSTSTLTMLLFLLLLLEEEEEERDEMTGKMGRAPQWKSSERNPRAAKRRGPSCASRRVRTQTVSEPVTLRRRRRLCSYSCITVLLLLLLLPGEPGVQDERRVRP